VRQVLIVGTMEELRYIYLKKKMMKKIKICNYSLLGIFVINLIGNLILWDLMACIAWTTTIILQLRIMSFEKIEQ
jgi:hypothetical protein